MMNHLPTAPGWRSLATAVVVAAVALFALPAHAEEDLPTVTIEDATAREGSIITFIARLDKPNRTRQLLLFSWRTRGGTATPGQDYRDNEYTASFWPGASTTQIHLFTTRDDLDEGSETFELVASNPWRLKLGNNTATGTIEDPPRRVTSNLPVVSVIPAKGVVEGEAALFTLVASPRPTRPLRVGITIGQTGAFAASGQTGRRTITIPTRGQASFAIPTADDGRNEAPGSVDVTVLSGSGYHVTGIRRYRAASVEVVDNDKPVIRVSATVATVSEGRAASFRLQASPRPASPIAVRMSVTQKGEFAAEGQLGERTVTIGSDGQGTFRVATASDARDEDDGFITASLVSAAAYTVGSPDSARVVVTDGGAPTPRISLRAITAAIDEGGTARFEITASPRPATPLGVWVEITDSGSFADQGEVGTRLVTLGPSGRATIDVATVDDLVSEPDGSLAARVVADAGYLVTAAARAAVRVRDTSIEIRIHSAGDIVEGETARFTLTAHPKPPESLAVQVSITERGSFLPGGAYTETITIDTDGRATLLADTLQDERAEADGTIVATVERGYGYAPGTPARATAGVADSTPTVTIAAGPAIIEGDTARFSLTARPAPARNLSVRLRVTETAGGSFVAAGELGEAYATIFAGDGTGTLELVTENDETDESGGTISAVILADGDGYYRVGSPRSATLRVNDDDHGQSALAVSLGDARGQEGEQDEWGRTRLAFPVTLSRPAGHWVTVYVQARSREESGTVPATPDVDYRATGPLAPRWVRFRPGATRTFVHVGIFDDAEHEPEETFELVISRVWGAEIADGRATGTILPDPLDAPRGTPVVTITAEGAVEEGQRARFRLRAAPAPAADLVVHVTVYDDSLGTPESDYLAEGDEGVQTVTIPGIPNPKIAEYYGDSLATLSLNTVDDDHAEAGGKVSVYVDNSVDGSYEAGQELYAAEVGVRDNDGPSLSVTPAFSIADATAYESDGSIRFDVTLDPPVPSGAGPMTVRYQTLTWAGGARRNVDFEDGHGTLTFYEGDSWKEIEVRILDDQHDEGAEAFHVYLSNPRGGARIADPVARGVIMNSDPMPAAWLARFGRTVAEQALDGIADRTTAVRSPGVRGNVAGQPLTPRRGRGDSDNPARATAAGPVQSGIVPSSRADPVGSHASREAAWRTRESGRELLLGSRFALTSEADSMGGSLALWGRASRAHFDGREGNNALDGDVTTTMLGADYARDKWLLGLTLTQSTGKGDYRDVAGSAGSGKVESSLTAVIPYAALQASERLQLWGALGRGSGDVSLTAEKGDEMKADTDWSMVAFGVRGDLLDPAAEGARLALVSDAFWAGMSSAKTTGLVATESDVTRVRLGLEGSLPVQLSGGSRLTPRLEAGLRRDGGDAETGLGVALGGGIAWEDPELGVVLDIEGRTLVAHDDNSFDNRAISASFAFDPDPASGHGPSLALRRETGGGAAGGLDALFGHAPLDEHRGAVSASRWETEAAYGFRIDGGRFIGSPHVGFGLDAGTRDYRLGWRLTPAANAPDLALGVQASRREADAIAPEHTIGLEAIARW